MERKRLPKVDPQKGLLLRFIDDFLLITREPEVAKSFLSTLQEGVAEYNCHVSPAKTSTNFDVLSDGSLERSTSKYCTNGNFSKCEKKKSSSLAIHVCEYCILV